MTDTTHEAPERIWVDYWLTGKKPRQVTEEDLGGCTEYVRADLVQAAVAAALGEAAEDVRQWGSLFCGSDDVTDEIANDILALIPKGEE